MTTSEDAFAVNSMRELAGLPVEAQEIISRGQQNFTRLLIENISAEDPKLDSAIIADVVLTFFDGLCIMQNKPQRWQSVLGAKDQESNASGPQFVIA